jgi:hypothetical protein
MPLLAAVAGLVAVVPIGLIGATATALGRARPKSMVP